MNVVYTTLLIWFLFGVVLSTKKDIVFVIDRSISIGPAEFQKAIDFIYNVTTFLQISGQDILISVVLFDVTPVGIFDFDEHTNKQSLLIAINNIKNVPFGNRSSTNTAGALNYTLSLFNAQNGSRAAAGRTAVILTDGDSDDTVGTINSANALRHNNISLYGLGIGLKSTNELLQMAGGNQGVLETSSFEYLCNLVPSLVPKLDPSAHTAIVNNCPKEPTTTSQQASVTFTVSVTVYNGAQGSTSSTKNIDNNTGKIAGATSAVCLLLLILLLVFLIRKCLLKRKTQPDDGVIIGEAPRRTAF